MEAKTDVASAPLHPIVRMPYYDQDGITICIARLQQTGCRNPFCFRSGELVFIRTRSG